MKKSDKASSQPPVLQSSQYSEKFDLALKLAAVAHKSQCRKKTFIPYIIHPIHVSAILRRYDCSEELVIAGLLHDVVEDTDYGSSDTVELFRSTFLFFENNLPVGSTAAEVESQLKMFIEEIFGLGVYGLVMAVTDPKVENDSRSWRERKSQQMLHLDGASESHAILKAADLIHNMETIISELSSSGNKVFSCFSGSNSRVDVPWYYCTSANKVEAILSGCHPIAVEVGRTANRLKYEVLRIKSEEKL